MDIAKVEELRKAAMERCRKRLEKRGKPLYTEEVSFPALKSRYL